VPANPSWWGGLDPTRKALLIVTAAALPLFLCCGGLAVMAAVTDDPPERAAPPVDSGRATATASASPSPSPTVVKRTVTDTEEIAFQEVEVADASLPEGTREVRTEGVAGVRTIRYEVTVTNGVQTGKRKVSEEVTREPVDRVVAVGTRQPEPEPEPEQEPEPTCHPNYAGACVPFASDVDCAGGSGNGPAYVRGPVRIIGPDIYDLDRDGDGVACER
jgi:hypothetical protein